MGVKSLACMGIRLLKQYGVKDFYYKVRERADFQVQNHRYQKNLADYFPDDQELEKQRRKQWEFAPLISIVVPAYETAEKFLRQLIDSVLNQTYGNLELCLADGSVSDCVENVVLAYRDSRISYRRLNKNKGISENTNQGFDMAKGDYIALLDHDDLLTPNALYEMVKVLNEADVRPDMIYSDEDKVMGDSGNYCEPYFKTDYNEELLRRNNYICHFLLFSREILEKSGGLNANYDGAQDHEFVLRCKKNGAVFYHIPKILYHWRMHQGSTSYDPASKLYAYENGKKAVRDYLKSRNVEAKVELTKDLGFYRVSYVRNQKMSVTVLVHSLKQLERLKKRTEISGCTEVTWKNVREPGNTEMDQLSSDYVMLVGEGMAPKKKDWLEQLASFCQEERVGAVSGVFVDGRNKVLQNSLIVSREGKVYPLFEGLPKGYQGYFRRASTPGNVSALSFDFLLLSRKAWNLSGKFDENFSFPAREVDFFARLRGCGYEAVSVPEVKIFCSGGAHWDYQIKKEEFLRLEQKWGQSWRERDLAYNPNFWQKDGKFTLRKQ